VSGVGVADGKLTVSLESDDAALHGACVVARAGPGAAPAFVVTGTFRPL
jgi:hypothetical protein